MADEMPGANVMAVVMNAPPDIMNMATRHVTEVINTMNAGVSALGSELARPPILPSGMPTLPGMPAFGQAAQEPATAPAVPAMFGAKKTRLIR